MKCNVGGVDRTMRLIVGVALLLVGFFAPLSALWQAIAFIVAAVALITGAIQFCPLNAMLGLNTCHGGEKIQHQ